MHLLNFLEAPFIIFLVIVAPLWIILHYKTLSKKNAGLSQDEHLQLEELSEMAGKMSDRITTLEAILDQESSQWREKYEQ